MNRFVLPFLPLLLLVMIGCTDNKPKSTPKEETKEQLIQPYDIERFKLFPTQNMWTFIKLDTQTGQMWQVQYSIKGDEGRFEYDLNPNPLITTGKKVNGRFELYSTQNIYNFILLDKIDGKVWQVPWSFDEENRAVVPINRAAPATI